MYYLSRKDDDMKKIAISTLLSALIAAPAMAAVPGAYVALDVQSWSTTNNAPLGNPGTGLRVGAGYRFHPNVGVEVDYAQSGSSSTTGGLSYKTSALQLAAVGTYAINPQFDVLAKAGVSANKGTASGFTYATSSKTDLLLGVGGQYNITQEWGVRLQYESLGKVATSGGNDMKASTVSLGVVYAF